MKTNDEFLKGVYGKRDALVKKRKKRMALTTTAVCAVLCAAAVITANVFDGNSSITKVSHKTEIEQGGYMNQNGNEIHSGELNADYDVLSDKIQSEKIESVTEVADDSNQFKTESLETTEIVTEIAIEGVPGNSEDFNYGNDGSEVETEIAESVGEQGTSVIEMSTAALKEGIVEGDSAELKPTMPAPPEAPMYSTEEIVEAAYNVIPEEEREFIIKDSANATVTRYADGRQEYEVGFQTTQDKYVKIKLDSELNPLLQGAE